MALSAFSGKGTIYMAPVDSTGTKTGEYRKVGNAYPFSFQAQTEVKKQLSRLHDTAGQTLHAKAEITESTGTLTLHQYDFRNLAYALSGSYAANDVSGSSVTDEEVTAGAPDEWIELDYQNISAVTVTTDPAGTTYDETDDYVIDYELGLITITADGDISEDDDLLVDYTYASDTDYKISIADTAQRRVAILGNIQDEYSEDKWRIEFYSVLLNSNSELNFISEPDNEWETIEFTCTFETPSGQTVPGMVYGVST